MAVALTLVDQLLGMRHEDLRFAFANMDDEERIATWQALQDAEENPYYRYRNDAYGFVSRGLHEATWSKQREILQAVNQHRRVVVAASHSTGKSYIASRAASAVALSWPPELVRVQTTATNFRQVKGILWPYMSRMHHKYGFPGTMHTTSWKIGSEEVGSGFSASVNNEAAVSGFHADGELFLVVDEGGGIHPVLGQAFNNLLTGTGHSLVIGNFPTDSDNTWFNTIWNSDQWHRIRISAFDTPNFPRPGGKSLDSMKAVRELQAQYEPDDPEYRAMFEQVGRCTVCPPSIDPHTIAKHLTDIEWVEGIAAEFGEESSYYRSRVLAEPAGDLADKTLPISWLEGVRWRPEDGETIKPGPVKLGVDVAADGGDEFVIARMIGWHVSVPFYRAGEANANTMDVMRVVLEWIDEAEEYHRLHGITERVRVKLDAIGIGRGVADRLAEMGSPGYVNDAGERGARHNAVIVKVESSRSAWNTQKFKNQRSEMWWTVRELIQPDPKTGDQGLLQVEWSDGRDGSRLLKQLSAPSWASNSAGQTVVELKVDIKKKTGSSPDRADALLLAVYEPPGTELPNIGGVIVGQQNYWGAAGTGGRGGGSAVINFGAVGGGSKGP